MDFILAHYQHKKIKIMYTLYPEQSYDETKIFVQGQRFEVVNTLEVLVLEMVP